MASKNSLYLCSNEARHRGVVVTFTPEAAAAPGPDVGMVGMHGCPFCAALLANSALADTAEILREVADLIDPERLAQDDSDGPA